MEVESFAALWCYTQLIVFLSTTTIQFSRFFFYDDTCPTVHIATIHAFYFESGRRFDDVIHDNTNIVHVKSFTIDRHLSKVNCEFRNFFFHTTRGYTCYPLPPLPPTDLHLFIRLPSRASHLYDCTHNVHTTPHLMPKPRFS